MSGVKKAGRKKVRTLKQDEMWHLDFLAKYGMSENRVHYWLKQLDIKMEFKLYHRTNRVRAVLTKDQVRAILLAVKYTDNKVKHLKRVAHGFRGEVAA